MKIAIIGAGNIGSAVVSGLVNSTLFNSGDISVSDINQKQLNFLKSQYPGINISNSNLEIAIDSDIIVIAVKPFLVETVANDMRHKINYSKQIIVSLAVGVDFEQMKTLFSPEATFFRVIPNTALEVSQSLSLISSYNANQEHEDLIKSIFDELGKTLFIPESQINTYVPVTSSGIAFAFRYIRAATEGAVEIGVPPKIAKQVILQTLRGAIDLLETNDTHPEAEIDKVTTAGGVTIRGLNKMEANGFSNAVVSGLRSSFLKD